MKLIDVIDALKDTYGSIDIRTFSFLQNEWRNLFSIIRFRRESVDDLKSQHDAVIEKCGGLIQTDEFRVGLFQFPTEKWEQISENLSQKFLCLRDDYAINFPHPVTFHHSANESYPATKEHIFKDWKVFSSYSEDNTWSKPNYCDLLRDDALRMHFSNFDDYLAAIFQFDRYDFQSRPWVNTFIPVFFKEDYIKFDHDKVTVQFTAYPQKNLEMTVNFYDNTHYERKSEFIDRKIKEFDISGSKNFISHEGVSMSLNTKSLGDEFELLVTKNKTALITNHRGKISDNWKDRSEFTNPIYSVFEKFVDYEELEKMLFEFTSKKIKGKDRVFERGVSWLLSLLGIPNIVLEEYEKINDGSNSVSVDMLGHLGDNQLALINVTIGLPQQSDFEREKAYRDNLSKFLKNKDLEIKSIYFTGTDPKSSESNANSNNVTLITHSRIKLILGHLKKGNITQAKKIITNSDF